MSIDVSSYQRHVVLTYYDEIMDSSGNGWDPRASWHGCPDCSRRVCAPISSLTTIRLIPRSCCDVLVTIRVQRVTLIMMMTYVYHYQLWINHMRLRTRFIEVHYGIFHGNEMYALRPPTNTTHDH
jgi:hypothetical protein